MSLVLLLVIAGGCQGIRSRFGSFSKRPPSMVILLADDAGYSDFGFTGLSQIETPHIDQIARQGVVCEQGYVCASVCSPSRAGLLTGRYPQRFGHEMNLPAGSGLGLALTERTIADRLKRLGYATGAVGKWHLGEEPPYRPRQRGFDSFQGFLGGSRTYHDRASLARRTVWLDGDAPAPLPDPYVTDAITYDIQGRKVVLTSFVVPVQNKDGKFLGVLGADLELNALSERFAELAQQAVEEGFTAFKSMAVPETMSLEGLKPIKSAESCVRAMREAVGDDIDIMVEMHTRYDLPTGIRIVKALEPYDPLWIEEPVPAENMDSLREITLSSNIPICVGENLFLAHQFRTLLEKKAADIIMP
ncbi:MAG: hypothetical protein DSY92_01445, partial [Planctomycetota bacterium]